MTRSGTTNLLLALVVAAGPFGSLPDPESAQEGPAVVDSIESSSTPGEFIVSASPESAAAAGLLVVREVGFGWTLVTSPVQPGIAEIESATEIAALTGFDVQPNYRYDLADEPLFPDQWSLENTGQTGGTVDADVDILDAWVWTSGSPDVIIAVLDTGVAFAHPDLSSNLWVNTGEVDGNGIDDDGNGFVDDRRGWDAVDDDADPSDTHGHGTFVATTAAAAVNAVGMAGVAPESAVMPVRVCDNDGCPLSAILTGLAYVIANGADVANLSFGGNFPISGGMDSAIRDAINAGTTVVAAAGNESRNNDLLPFYPASYDIDGLIAVAASDHNDLLAPFSNYGATSVDLAAPGQNVVGGILTGDWTVASGTSFSAPHVAGVAALVKSLRPDLTPQDVAVLIIESGDVLSDLSGKVASGGRLNAGSAVELATAPIAVAKAAPASGTLPFTVQLSGTQSWDPLGQIVTWSWKLPDASVVNAAETSWSPSRPGAYKATLTVVDDDGLTDSAVVSIIASLRPGGTFVDDNGHFAEGAIEAIAAEGITRGCNPPVNDRYCPAEEVTRGQMAAFLSRALGLPGTATDFFGDDDASVFEGAINRLAAAGITIGCNPPVNSRFCPDDHVTRGQMAAFLARALGLVDGAGADVFVDDDDSIFEMAIDKIATVGITNGCNPPANDHYCPGSATKRGEMAAFLTRALGLKPFYPPPAT